jgi:hypothetical protein
VRHINEATPTVGGSAQFEVRHINEATPTVGPSMKQRVAVPSPVKTVSDGEDGGCHGLLASVTGLLRYNVVFFLLLAYPHITK